LALAVLPSSCDGCMLQLPFAVLLEQDANTNFLLHLSSWFSWEETLLCLERDFAIWVLFHVWSCSGDTAPL